MCYTVCLLFQAVVGLGHIALIHYIYKIMFQKLFLELYKFLLIKSYARELALIRGHNNRILAEILMESFQDTCSIATNPQSLSYPGCCRQRAIGFYQNALPI